MRLQRLHDVLVGTAVGDAFGQRFLEPGSNSLLARRALPEPVWTWTDDTVQAVAIAEHLAHGGALTPSAIGDSLARAWSAAPDRGFGASAGRLFRAVTAGADSAVFAAELFAGMGSAGNGSAMRVAPVGAWLDSRDEVAAVARATSLATHTHEEAIDGAVAIALATFDAFALRGSHAAPKPLTDVAASLPAGTLRSRLNRAARLSERADVRTVTAAVGSSISLLARDTVPFCLWVFQTHADDFEAAMWSCVTAGGDTDTTCAIVGALVAARGGADAVPRAWRDATESPAFVGM